MPTPSHLRPDQIRDHEFAEVKRGGYDPKEVRAHLERVAVLVGSLRDDLVQAEARLHGMQERLVQAEERARTLEAAATESADPYEQFGHRFADLLRNAEAEAERIRSEARAEADRMRSQSRSMLGTAKQDVTVLLQAGDSLGTTLNEMRERLEKLEGAVPEGQEGSGTVSAATPAMRTDPASDQPNPSEKLEDMFYEPGAQ